MLVRDAATFARRSGGVPGEKGGEGQENKRCWGGTEVFFSVDAHLIP